MALLQNKRDYHVLLKQSPEDGPKESAVILFIGTQHPLAPTATKGLMTQFSTDCSLIIRIVVLDFATLIIAADPETNPLYPSP